MEVLFFVGVVFALYLWFRFFNAIFRVRQFRPHYTHRILSAILPWLCLVFIVVVLLRESASDVRTDIGWIAGYTIGGAVWLQLGLILLSCLGVAARDDVFERQNPAAAWLVYGAMAGTTFCYAGSKIGNGPGPDVVLFCAVLSTTFLFAFWSVLERSFRLADRITIERDESVGIRAGGWIASLGLIFGGAVAGDWVSVEGTIRDFFRYAWVALLFLFTAILIEALFKKPKRGTSNRSTSAILAFIYVATAAGYVAWRGVH